MHHYTFSLSPESPESPSHHTGRPLTPQMFRKRQLSDNYFERTRSLTHTHARQIKLTNAIKLTNYTHVHPKDPLVRQISPPVEGSDASYLRYRPLPQLPQPIGCGNYLKSNDDSTDYAEIQQHKLAKSVIAIDDDADDYVDVSELKGPKTPPASNRLSPARNSTLSPHHGPPEEDYVQMKASPLPTTPMTNKKANKGSVSSDDVTDRTEDYVEMFSSPSAKGSPWHTPLTSPKLLPSPLRPRSELHEPSPLSDMFSPVKKALSCDLLELCEDDEDDDDYIDMLKNKQKFTTTSCPISREQMDSIYEPIDLDRPIPPPRRKRKAKKLKEQISAPEVLSTSDQNINTGLKKSNSISAVSSQRISPTNSPSRSYTMRSKSNSSSSGIKSPELSSSKSNTIRTNTQKLLKLLKVT